MNAPLPPAPQALIDELGELLRVDRFLVFGGIALDMLVDPDAFVHDVDVAVDAAVHDVDTLVGRLLQDGLKPGSVRDYRINRDEPVSMLDLEWGDRILDLNFCVRFDRIGQFDIESLVWRWPERDFVDRHGAREALRRRTIRLLRDVDGEDPVLLVVRVLKLAAKYGITIVQPAHRELVAAIDRALERRLPEDEEERRAIAVGQAALMRRTIARAADPDAYVRDVHASGLLRHTAPELHASLEERVASPTGDG